MRHGPIVEIEVRDWQQSLLWYRDRLGLSVVMSDPPRGYVLLERAGLRLAIKHGTPTPGGIRIFWEVENLPQQIAMLEQHGVSPASPLKVSDEGYRRILLRDPDGYTIGLFDWLTPPTA
ncbi:VOC family protein [Tuwongella immobilis]|uniref:VOC domain-containing protein n=1 Tax=Tuwongella immobilis TaxID=692036 RepID=A0A6C2YM60_9BACT|nr:VOC family protein [Tuwongella immobilis]VIP02213.1 Lactoylglutathione lyase family protein OS=Singulisphaera acidiphila (strain ATCC BAA-1392 / DSM 18658 / VKM B-2454 / MOB10) GN=Sinac_5024 PE=4 SV=1: Glyoxalase_2 [Tuwongella immobilis]VTS00726.1 Lactoylglutathione lyase family protein OS=Singulisphaera acidiphila (strain ATCC BAA-1392 / DSM 18658 / VKM B-2454 / MOB10) GN=Sinac_5024 PE=4 SV=1: Glyoxalase_2 [Tuwongella immobilis]